MNRKLTRSISLSLVFFSLVIALPLSQIQIDPSPPAAQATEWEEGQPVGLEDKQSSVPQSPAATTAATTYRTLSGTRFQPTASAMTYAPLGGAIYATALPPGGYSFSLDFDLPSGATLTEVVFYVIDNDATNMNFSLRSYIPESDTFTTLESALSSGASATLQTIVIAVDPPVQVDNTATSYRLRVAPGVASTNHLLRGARIGYTVATTYLPVVVK